MSEDGQPGRRITPVSVRRVDGTFSVGSFFIFAVIFVVGFLVCFFFF